ncbi:Hus1 domain containing protein [Trichuris trichiura]|uniref:Checkpoint protein n=1 Tax=Trichuris trichiura TaxID=36087 RepID=A0A077ZF84_TRITR|nr:Hus1 domain containing protein [Trichuris trichiura]
MKFSSKFCNADSVDKFSRLLSVVSKLCKECEVRICKDKFQLAKKEAAVDNGQKLICDFSLASFFSEFRMDGWNAENDEIYLALSPDQVFQALRTLNLAKSVKMKLTKKSIPYLTFEIKLPSLAASDRLITHDIPVTVWPPRLWNPSAFDDFSLHPEVTLLLPPLKVVQRVIAGMKHMGQHVLVMGTKTGEMTLTMRTDEISVSTFFPSSTSLSNSTTASHNNTNATTCVKSESSSARVEIKWLMMFLSIQLPSHARAVVGIVDDRLIHLCVVCEDYRLQYLIPAVLL